MKNLKLKSLLLFSFAILSLGSFADEKIYEAKGESKAFNEDGVPLILTVKATKKDGKIVIKDIIAEHQETDKIGGLAITKLITEVKEKQNYAKVDNVAGATVTSAAFRRALRNAVKDLEKQN